ncbi:MAG: hypothetical protein WCD83_17200, partial [Pseudolabrys sp.]
AQERADRWRQSFSNENSSSWGSQTDVRDAASGKTSPYASDTRTPQIVDGKLISRTTLHSWDMGGRMNNIIWLVGAVAIILFILGALGLRP